MTKEKFKMITDALVFNPQDAVVKASNLTEELERQGILSTQYSDWYARLGKYKLRTELEIKKLKAQIELEYRTGKRQTEIERLTDATVKAYVEADAEVMEKEELLTEITWWYNRSANYSLAMNQRLDIMRMLQREKER